MYVCDKKWLFKKIQFNNLLNISEFGVDCPSVSSRIEHVLSGRVRRRRTRSVHAVNGILYARRLWPRTRRGEMVRLSRL